MFPLTRIQFFKFTTVGGKRAFAFYMPDSGNCGVNTLVWGNTEVGTDMPNSAARVRSLNLQCGDNEKRQRKPTPLRAMT